MAATVTVMGTRQHLCSLDQRVRAAVALRQVETLAARGDRDHANGLLMRTVHAGVEPLTLFEEASRMAEGFR